MQSVALFPPPLGQQEGWFSQQFQSMLRAQTPQWRPLVPQPAGGAGHPVPAAATAVDTATPPSPSPWQTPYSAPPAASAPPTEPNPFWTPIPPDRPPLGPGVLAPFLGTFPTGGNPPGNPQETTLKPAGGAFFGRPFPED